MTEVTIPTIKKFKAGTADMVSSLSLVVMFDSAFNSTPRVVVTPKQDMNPTTLRWWGDTNTNTLVITVSAAASSNLVFRYICVGNAI